MIFEVVRVGLSHAQRGRVVVVTDDSTAVGGDYDGREWRSVSFSE